MEHRTSGEAAPEDVGARRATMRELARSRRRPTSDQPEGFHSPAWLDRSFVLPLTAPHRTDIPDQRARTVPEGAAVTAPVTGSEHLDAEADTGFVRPPSEDIDFAAVIRRSDLSRGSLRAAWCAIAVGALAMIAYLLTHVQPVAVLAVACGVVALGSALLRFRLLRAPVPRLER